MHTQAHSVSGKEFLGGTVLPKKSALVVDRAKLGLERCEAARRVPGAKFAPRHLLHGNKAALITARLEQLHKENVSPNPPKRPGHLSPSFISDRLLTLCPPRHLIFQFHCNHPRRRLLLAVALNRSAVTRVCNRVHVTRLECTASSPSATAAWARAQTQRQHRSENSADWSSLLIEPMSLKQQAQGQLLHGVQTNYSATT